jgi:hypothetical protein
MPIKISKLIQLSDGTTVTVSNRGIGFEGYVSVIPLSDWDKLVVLVADLRSTLPKPKAKGFG